MSTVKNKDLLNSMRETMSQEYQGRVSKVAEGTGIEVLNTLNDYPTLKNEFLDVLTNKVIKSQFYSKVFENPLKMFHRGSIPYGSSIEQLFVEMAEKKGFREHFNGSTSVESDLIGVQKPSILAKYITKNFEYKYKVTISEEQLRTAFMNSTGLSELISQIMSSLTSGAYFDEFNDMKKLLEIACKHQKYVIDKNTGLGKVVALNDSEAGKMKTVDVDDVNTNPKHLSETLRALAGRLTFPSKAYNMAGVNQWSKREDLVFITTPEIIAKLDVNVLAEAFNVSKAEINTRTVVVDELPTTYHNGTNADTAMECYGLLIDKDFLQIYDTIMTMRKFDNGANLTVNHFLHKQGMLANCYFANSIIIKKK